jgi:hypothetical protein
LLSWICYANRLRPSCHTDCYKVQWWLCVPSALTWKNLHFAYAISLLVSHTNEPLFL